MTVRRFFALVSALVAGLFVAGCAGGDGSAFSSETDDPLFLQGKQLQKQGRNAEALTAFLKVAEKRGEQASPESHLEAGLIYLQHIKEPVEAIHHFRKYLELEPTSKQTGLVRQRIDLARRELYLAMPGRPSDDQPVRLGTQELIEKLQRENEAMRAELGRLTGTAPASAMRTLRGPVVPVGPPKGEPAVIDTRPRVSSPVLNLSALVPAPPNTGGAQPTPKPGSSGGAAGASGATAGKRHVIAPGDNLYRVAQKYGVTVEVILAVNRDILPNGAKTTLRQGMELKIP